MSYEVRGMTNSQGLKMTFFFCKIRIKSNTNFEPQESKIHFTHSFNMVGEQTGSVATSVFISYFALISFS